MSTINNIYENILGITLEITDEEQQKIVILETGNVSFTINHKELTSFIHSINAMIKYHKDCTYPTNVKNKIVIYETYDIEVRMKLSYEELFQLRDLLKGTKFKLEMDEILNHCNITNL